MCLKQERVSSWWLKTRGLQGIFVIRQPRVQPEKTRSPGPIPASSIIVFKEEVLQVISQSLGLGAHSHPGFLEVFT